MGRRRFRSCTVLAGLGLLLACGLVSSPGAAPIGSTGGASAFLPSGWLRAETAAMRPSSVKRVTAGSWWGGSTVASTGETVNVYLSDSFTPDDATRATWANFFAWLDHGSELASLTVYIATLAEVQAFCGAEAAGCYSPASKVLLIPGDLGEGVDFDIAAHEYGHHIASSRRNDPWDPNGWGPKRWATYVGVCSRAAAGKAFPGDEGQYYTLNTGEAFAEAYRALEEARGMYPWARLPLVVDPSFAPEAGADAAALAGVRQPWNGPASTGWDGSFTAPTVNLTAAVGPGRTIALKTAATATARSLAAGTYAISVRDLSAKDNFHLSGGGLDRKTGVPGRGRVTWTLALKPGVYRYRSDAHPDLRGSFVVTAAAQSITGAPRDRTISTALDGTFQATVSGSANATVELLDPASGQVIAGATPGPLSATICGQRSVQLRVAARQAGTFHVAITTP